LNNNTLFFVHSNGFVYYKLISGNKVELGRTVLDT